MALRTFNPASGKWEVVAASQAVEVKVVDLEDNFESNNVEGCLRELKDRDNENLSKIEELLSDFADHILNHPGGSGPGGPGGGGGTDMYVTVTTQMNTNIITSVTSQVIIEFEYDSSIKKDGTATVTVNNILKNTRKVPIGPNSIDVTSFIEKGNNELVIEVANMYGVKESIIFNIDVVDLEITSAFNYTTAFTDSIAFPYSIKGSVSKIVHFILDDKEIHTETIKSTNTIQKIYTIPKQEHGVHKLKVYATSSLGNDTLTSNELNFEFISIDDGNNTVLISSQFDVTAIDQYSMLSIPFVVYDPSNLKANIDLKINDKVMSSLSVNREEQRWNLTNYPAGETSFTIQCGDVKRDFVVDVKEVIIDVTEETNGLELYLSSNGRNNSEDNKDVWKFGDIQAEFNNFNWVSDGWLADEKGFTALTVSGDANVVIPFKPFANDCRILGKTIEIEFEVLDSIDYDAVVISCMDHNRGFQISCKDAIIKSNETSTKTLFKDGERLRVSFCIEASSSTRIIYTYIDGIVSGLTQYSPTDIFIQQEPVNITIGSNKCITRVYNIRVYDNCLSTTSILNNFIYDKDDINSKMDSYNKNNIYDSYGQIVYSRILNQIPCMTITGTLPETKGDLKTVSVKFENKEDSSKNIADPSVTIDVQGTSSQYFPRKNYTLTFNNPYQLRDGSIPVSTFCIKADFMESSHVHNTGLAKVIDGLYTEKVPPQITNSKIRTTIDGYPIAVFYKETDADGLKFYGVYNFNNDKSTHQVFGYGANSECWELCNNTSQRVLFTQSDYSSDDWQNDFQSRYPAKNTDYTNLKRLTDWLVEVKDDFPRFKEEFRQYFNEHYTLMYYLITELFGMVDSRAKNMFLASWDKKIWYPVFYDMDTVLGINNEGVLGFGYNIEYHDSIGELNIFNGERSSLWNNVEKSFPDEIATLYKNLRNNGILTYEKVLNILVNEQISKICEAQYNEDAKHKYLDPLKEDNISTFLYAAQGSRENHLKYWLYNRINYMDSKYLSSAYKDNYITLRLYTPSEYKGVKPSADFTLTPYADQYVRVKYGTYEVFNRSKADEKTLIKAPTDIVFNDTETIIYGANRLSDIGDLSDKYAGTIDVSKATQLGELIIGSNKEGYTNSNLLKLSLGNNRLLRKLNINNCVNLSQSLDVSGCNSIEEIYATGTSLSSMMLPPTSGNLKILHLPGTITNLTILNKPKLQILKCESYDKVNILRLENAGVNALTVFNQCKNVQYVRLMQLDASAGYVTINRLMKTKGIDENGSQIPISQAVSGRITLTVVSEHLLDIYKNAFPFVEFVVEEYAKSYEVIFKDGDDKTVYVDNVIESGEAIYDGPTPTKTSTPKYDYLWEGWNRDLKPILGPTTITATFVSKIRSYTIRFINPETEHVVFEQVVNYGEMPEIPELPKQFNYWGSVVEPVTGDKDYTAVFVPLPKDYSIFNFTNNDDGKTLTCTLRSVPNLPPQVIIPFIYENKFVTGLKGEASIIGKENITEMYIPNSIKNWGSYIYNGCSNLDFSPSCVPETLPSDNTCDFLFHGWSGLTHMNYPKGVTNIGSQCFRGCTNLRTINIPEGVTTLHYACFYGCTNLVKVDLPKSVRELTNSDLFAHSGLYCLNGPGVTKFTSLKAFDNAKNCKMIALGSKEYPITKCDVKNITANNVTKTIILTTQNGVISDVLEGTNSSVYCTRYDAKCMKTDTELYAELNDGDDNDKALLCHCLDKNITSYDLTNIAGRKAYDIIWSFCFENCTKLTSINIPDSVNILGEYCFSGCSGLVEINICEQLSEIRDYCFKNCRGLVEIEIPGTVKTISQYCFFACTELQTVRLLEGVTKLDRYCFNGCSKLNRMEFPDSLHTLGAYCFQSTGFTHLDTKNVTSLGAWCFSYMDKLKTINIPKISELNESIFHACSPTYISLGSKDYPVINIGKYNNCTGLFIVTTRNGVQDDIITAQPSVPYYFTKMDSKIVVTESEIYVELNDGVNNNKAIMCECLDKNARTYELNNIAGTGKSAYGPIRKDCFSRCKITDITIPEGVTSIGAGCFHSCEFLRTVSIPDTVKNFYDSCFQNCRNLSQINIPDAVTHIPFRCFYDCLILNNIELPNTIKSFGDECFANCRKISQINIPDGVTRLPNKCFISCVSLTNINLPDTVSSLGRECFKWSGLIGIDCKNVSELGVECFINCNNLQYINMPSVSRLNANIIDTNIKFVSIGSVEHPAESVCSGNHICRIITTENGVPSDVGIAENSYDYFTTLDSRWVKTENEIYAELLDDDNDKVILGECSNKRVTSYDLTSIGDDNRRAYGPLPKACFKSCTLLKNIEIPTGVTKLGQECFADCSVMSKITIGDSVETIGESCFKACNKLTRVELPESTNRLEYKCFDTCTELKSIEGPGVTSVRNWFIYNCNIDYLNLPKMSEIPDSMFTGTIKYLAMGSRETPITYIGRHNSNFIYSTLCILTTKNGLSSDPVIETQSNKYYFTSKSSKIVKTKKEMYAEMDDDKAMLIELYDKSISEYNLENINNTGRVACEKIHYGFFKNCTRLNNVTIPDGVTELSSYCFYGCSSLTNFSLSSTVESIDQFCFGILPMKVFDCKNVSKIAYAAFDEAKIEVLNMPKVTVLPATSITCSTMKFVSIGSEGSPVTSITTTGNNLGRCCIITTVDGGPVSGITSSKIHFTNKGYRWVKTENEIYAEACNDNTKAIMGECLDKTVPTYNLNNIANTNRSAHGPIADYCFHNCESLTTINIPEGVTRLGYQTFRICRNLSQINIPESVTVFGGYCFEGCSSLKTVDIPNSVTTLEGGCFKSAGLTSIDCKNVTTIGGECFSFTHPVYINMPKVSVLPGGTINTNTIKFISMGSKDYPVTSIGSNNLMASCCCILTTATGNKEDVIINSNSNNYYFTTMDSKWVKTENEIYAELNDDNSRDKAIMGMSISKNIITYDLNNIAGTKRKAYGVISANCFNSCKIMTNISIPDGVESLYDSCFEGCGALNTVNLPNSLTRLGGSCFRGCGALKNIDCDNITSMGNYCFYTSGLQYINLPRISYIPDYAFYIPALEHVSLGSKECPVTYVGAVNFLWSQFTIITTATGTSEGVTFGNGAGVKNHFITMNSKWVKTQKELYAELNDDNSRDKAIMAKCLDRSVNSYDLNDIAGTKRKAYGTILGSCFSNCKNLTSISVPEGVTRLENGCFSGSGLQSISLPNSLTSIGVDCFRWCNQLATITGMNNLTNVEDTAFAQSSLQQISIPGPVNLGYGVFHNSKMKTVTLGSMGKPVQQFNGNAFAGLSQPETTITIFSSTGNESGIAGSPWGAGSNVSFIYEQA